MFLAHLDSIWPMSQTSSYWVHRAVGQILKYLLTQCVTQHHACVCTHTHTVQKQYKKTAENRTSSERLCHFSSGRMGATGGGNAQSLPRNY